MPTYPTLREKVERVLLDAGFRPYGEQVPSKGTGGVFELTSGAGVRVRVEWWDVSDAKRRALLEEYAAALRDARFVVSDRGDSLYVAELEERSDEE